MNHHQNALEALAQLSAVAGLIDTAECKDEGLYNRLQSALAVADASLNDAIKALSAAPQVVADELDADEKWTVAEQKAFAPFLAQFPNESSQGIISLGSAWKHGVAYGVALQAALAQEQEPVYQVSQPFPADPKNTWRDASSDAYDMSHPDRRRTLYRAPVQPVAVPDGSREAFEKCLYSFGQRVAQDVYKDAMGRTMDISGDKTRHVVKCVMADIVGKGLIEDLIAAAPAAQGEAKELTSTQLFELAKEAGRAEKFSFRIPGASLSHKVECAVLEEADCVKFIRAAIAAKAAS